MIALKHFLRPKPPKRIRLPQPSIFVLIRGADEERIDAEYDTTGTRMIRLVVHTRTR